MFATKSNGNGDEVAFFSEFRFDIYVFVLWIWSKGREKTKSRIENVICVVLFHMIDQFMDLLEHG